jgi:hypothetical protein
MPAHEPVVVSAIVYIRAYFMAAQFALSRRFLATRFGQAESVPAVHQDLVLGSDAELVVVGQCPLFGRAPVEHLAQGNLAARPV